MKYITLGEICKKGSSNIAQKDLEGNVGNYEIYGASGFIKKVDFYHQEKPYIAIVKDGAGVGRTMLLPAKSSVIGTMQYILPNDDIDIRYLYYAIDNMNLSKYYMGAAIPHIYFKDYQSEKLPVRDIQEQKQIADVLAKTDALIADRKAQLIKLDELVKSRFIELFGDPMLNTKGFQLVPYGSMFELNAGGTPSKKESKYWDGGTISWIGSNMCQNEIIYQNDGKYITEDGYNNSSARMFPIDTVLIALVGATIGKTALLKFETTTNQNVLGIRKIAESSNNPYFVFYYTQGLYNKFLEIGDGGFSMASKDFVSKLPFPIVPIDLQNEFATFVEQTDKLKFEVKEALEKLETLKKSLMQQYFG